MTFREKIRQMALKYWRDRLASVTEEIAMKRRELVDIQKHIRDLEGE